jgi:hypothetical protein
MMKSRIGGDRATRAAENWAAAGRLWQGDLERGSFGPDPEFAESIRLGYMIAVSLLLDRGTDRPARNHGILHGMN